MDNTFCSESSGAPANLKQPLQRLEISPTLHSEFNKICYLWKINQWKCIEYISNTWLTYDARLGMFRRISLSIVKSNLCTTATFTNATKRSDKHPSLWHIIPNVRCAVMCVTNSSCGLKLCSLSFPFSVLSRYSLYKTHRRWRQLFLKQAIDPEFRNWSIQTMFPFLALAVSRRCWLVSAQLNRQNQIKKCTVWFGSGHFFSTRGCGVEDEKRKAVFPLPFPT